MGPVAAGSTVQNGQCVLDADVPVPVASGTRLTVHFSMRFRANFAGRKETYQWIWGSNYTTNAGWQYKGAFNVTAAPPPTSSSTDQSGSGTSHTFTFQARSTNGGLFVNRVIVLFNWDLWLAAGCSVSYEGGVFTLAEDTPTSNPYCTLNGASAQPVGDDLILTINLGFKPAFKGEQKVYQIAFDASGLSSNWIQVGKWTAYTASPDLPQTQQLQPATGSGRAVTFQFKATDINGAGYMPTQALYLGSLTDPGCTLQIYHAGNFAYLVNDDGTVWTFVPAGGSATNGQCTVSGMSSVDSGNDWTFEVTADFKPAYAGSNRPIYQYVNDRVWHSPGYQPKGTWTVPSSGNLPLLSVAKSHIGNFLAGQNGAAYTVIVSNGASAGPNGGVVTLTEQLDLAPGLTLVSMSGTGWTCAGTACTRADALAPGASYPPVTVNVNVAAGATSPQVNKVKVSGGGSVSASTTDSTVIVPPAPILSIVKSHSGNFIQGSTGAYSVTVSNVGSLATTAPVTVTENLPAGLTLISMSGTGWGCAGSSCTRSDALPVGVSYPTLTVNVTVTAGPGSLTNGVTVSSGGSVSAIAADLTTIILPPTTQTISTSPVGLSLIVDGSNCTSPCTFSWNAGSNHTVAVSGPQTDSAGVLYWNPSWSDAGALIHSIITPSANSTYTANFQLAPTTTIQSVPAGLTFTVDNFACASPCRKQWIPGSSHSLVAGTQVIGASTRYQWSSWSLGAAASQTITSAAADTTYTATFTPQYAISAYVSPSAAGNITLTPPGGWYSAGTVVSIGAVVNEGWAFTRFTGSVTSGEAPQIYTVVSPGPNDPPVSVTANFAPDFSIKISIADISVNPLPVLANQNALFDVNIIGNPGPMALDLPLLPLGATIQFDQFSAYGYHATLHGPASGGTFAYTLRATSSQGVTHSYSGSIAVKDFTVTPLTPSQTGGPLETVRYQFAIAGQGGLDPASVSVGPINIAGTCSIGGLVTDFTAGIFTITLPITSCQSGTHAVDIPFVLSGIQHTAHVTLESVTSGVFSLTSPDAPPNVSGTSVTLPIRVTTKLASQYVYFQTALVGFPSCSTVTSYPAPVTATSTVPANTSITLNTADCPLGTYTVIVNGTAVVSGQTISSGLSLPFYIGVGAPATDFSLQFTTGNSSLAIGASDLYTLNVASVSGTFGQSVSLAVNAMPPNGVSVTFPSGASISGVGAIPVRVAAGTNSPAGPITITIVGTAPGPLVHSATLSLTLSSPPSQPGFTGTDLALIPLTADGTVKSVAVAVTTNGHTVTLRSLSALPPGMNASVSGHKVVLSAATTVSPGTYFVDLEADDGAGNTSHCRGPVEVGGGGGLPPTVPAPVITSVSSPDGRSNPATVIGGKMSTFTISGRNFGATQGAFDIHLDGWTSSGDQTAHPYWPPNLNGYSYLITSWSDQSIQVDMTMPPEGVGLWQFSIRRQGFITDYDATHPSLGSFRVYDPTPEITSITPSEFNAGTLGAPVTIVGRGFGSKPAIVIAGNGVTARLNPSVPPTDSQISAFFDVDPGADATVEVSVYSTGTASHNFTPAPDQQQNSPSKTVVVKPNTLGTISIDYRAFIRANWVLSPASCVGGVADIPLDLGSSLHVRGDNRTFSLSPQQLRNFPQSPPYRAYERLQLTPPTGFGQPWTLSGPVKDQGVSREYDGASLVTDSYALDPAGTGKIIDLSILDVPRICNGGSGLVKSEKGTPDIPPPSISTSAQGVTVTFSGQASDPNIRGAGFFAPIQWALAVTISPDGSTASVIGSHTCFPAHEILVNGKFLWRYGPNYGSGTNGVTAVPFPTAAAPSRADNDRDLLSRCLLQNLPYTQVQATISLR
ncbi:MAG: hypothetical protein ABI806_06550 [Candidatus Solibacter sp.]